MSRNTTRNPTRNPEILKEDQEVIRLIFPNSYSITQEQLCPYELGQPCQMIKLQFEQLTESPSRITDQATLKQMQTIVHNLAVEKGWYQQPRQVPELLLLLHSEISEACEAYRKDDKENFKEELADLAIRLLDMCEYLGIELTKEIQKKHKFNLTRPFRHGNKKI